MMTVNVSNGAKAKQLRDLAERFRAKAGETDSPNYIKLLDRYAAEFDRAATHLENASNALEGLCRRPH